MRVARLIVIPLVLGAGLAARPSAGGTLLSGLPVESAGAFLCDFDPLSKLPQNKQDAALDSLHKAPRAKEIQAHFPATSSETAGLVTALLVRCQLPISKNDNGVIEAHLGRQTGLTASYEITLYGYVHAEGDSSSVTLRADETMFYGSSSGPREMLTHIDSHNGGRSGQVWRAMYLIGQMLANDSVRASNLSGGNLPPTQATGQTFVGSISKKVFMLPGCPLAGTIDPADKVLFASEAEAKAAGFLRSGAEGC